MTKRLSRVPALSGGHRRFSVWVAACALVGLSAFTETASAPRYLPLLLVSLAASSVAALALIALRVSTPQVEGIVTARIGQTVRLSMWILLALVCLDLALRLPGVIYWETRLDFGGRHGSHCIKTIGVIGEADLEEIGEGALSEFRRWVRPG